MCIRTNECHYHISQHWYWYIGSLLSKEIVNFIGFTISFTIIQWPAPNVYNHRMRIWETDFLILQLTYWNGVRNWYKVFMCFWNQSGLGITKFTALNLEQIHNRNQVNPFPSCCLRAERLKVSLTVVSNSEIPWTVASPAPLSMEFSRQKYWSGLPIPSPKDLPCITSRFFTNWAMGSRYLGEITQFHYLLFLD